MIVIKSKQNPVVKELSSLKEKKGRRERGSFLVEGDKMVFECLKSGQKVVRIALLASKERMALFDLLRGRQNSIVFLSEDAFKAISDEKTPQGIIAEVKIPRFALERPKGNCLLLDGVSDPSNVGAMIRTAAAAGYRELYLIDCADPYSPKSVRASMSGVFYTKLMRGEREEVLNLLKDVPIVAADMGGENLFSFRPPEKFCIAVGNEGNGLSELVKNSAKYTVGIEMEEPMESLNAAVSAGIVMYALRSKIRKEGV